MKTLIVSSQERVIMGPYILGRKKKRMAVDKFVFLEFQKMSSAIMGLFFGPYFLGPKAMALLALWFSQPWIQMKIPQV